MTDEQFEELKNEIGTMRLQNGDCLVIKSRRPLSMDQAGVLHDRGKKLLQDLGIKGEVVIADGGIEYEVIRSAPSITLNLNAEGAGPEMSEALGKALSSAMDAFYKSLPENYARHNSDPRRRQ